MARASDAAATQTLRRSTLKELSVLLLWKFVQRLSRKVAHTLSRGTAAFFGRDIADKNRFVRLFGFLNLVSSAGRPFADL